MKLCIPVLEDRGLASPVCAHFGSAPCFVVVDTEDAVCRAIPNHEPEHEHGSCAPIAVLLREPLDGVAVGGIGRGALGRLLSAGLRVYLAEGPTVAEVLAALRAGKLRPVSEDMACAGHGHAGH